MARAQSSTKRGTLSDLARIVEAEDEHTALRILRLVAQGHSLARACRTVALSNAMVAVDIQAQAPTV